MPRHVGLGGRHGYEHRGHHRRRKAGTDHRRPGTLVVDMPNDFEAGSPYVCSGGHRDISVENTGARGTPLISGGALFADMKHAALTLFKQVRTDATRHVDMEYRLRNQHNGGGMDFTRD